MENNHVVKTAPIVKYLKGKTPDEVKSLCLKNKWTWAEVK